MKREQLDQLIKFASENNICMHTISVAFCIATDHCNDPKVIHDYGTIACDSLRQLKKEL